MHCFVPDCKNTIGVPFPKDQNTKNQWLEGLNSKDVPKPGSFVCFDHFKESDLNEEATESGRRLSNRLKRGAIPSISVSKLPECERNAATILCRTCMTNKNLNWKLNDEIDGDILIYTMLMCCAHPLKVMLDDELPKYICETCFQSLKTAYEFRLQVLKCDALLKSGNTTERCKSKRKLSEESEDESKIQKQEIHSSNVKVTVIEAQKDVDIEQDALTLSEIEVASGDIHMYEEQVEQEGDSESSENLDPKNVVINSIEKEWPCTSENIELPELLSEIKDANSKGILKLGQVTARVVQKPASVKSRHVEPPKKLLKIEEKLQKRDKTKRRNSQDSKTRVVREINVQNLNVPDCIKIKPVEVYESAFGLFPCSLRQGIFGSSFIEAGGYLFLFGLMKKGVRNLQCLVPTCKCTGEQKFIDESSYEGCVTVMSPHNHECPNEPLKKKQIFFHVMRKKMQNDKGLNIRNIYEEICAEEPELRSLVPLRNVINEICRYQFSCKMPQITSFQHFYEVVETDVFEKLHFTHSGQQFYQERFAADDGALALVFCNTAILDQVSDSDIMYVDASFKIDTEDDFKYQLVTVLVWLDDSYYPILFALVNKKTQEIFKKVFVHLRDVLAPKLKPQQIITDYEACLYYALGETYLESHIGGSVFYYTQNIYKRICSLNLAKDLETNSFFRNIYHMILMLPLLPVNTILDGFNNIEIQARDMGLQELARPIFDHVRQQWILNVTPELFCVHRLENRINENVIAPFKKLRDFLLLTKGKMQRTQYTIVHVVSKMIELESFLSSMYSKPDKKSFGRDLSTSQKKTVLRAWQFIETHPKININSFFTKVLGYIKCMENQLWIWGFYRYVGDIDDNLINASNFSIINSEDCQEDDYEEQDCESEVVEEESQVEVEQMNVQESVEMEQGILQQTGLVVEAVIDENGGVVLQSQNGETLVMEEESSAVPPEGKQFENAFLKYVYE